jgi:hypothetical protein
MNHLKYAREMYDLIAQGKLMDAFEKYYHANVVMVEATGEERKGKAANRKFQNDFLGMIKEVNGTGVNSITENEKDNITMVESWMDVTFKDGRRSKMEEVAVQKWEENQIIHERFYYNATPGM